MAITLDELNDDLESINIELTPEEIAWLRENYGEELAEKFSKKRKMKKQIWKLMQNNTVLRALIVDHKALRKQALIELKNIPANKLRLVKTVRTSKRKAQAEAEAGM